ncbi:hypothetical protein BBJ28_00018987 [Nothophytophthora sp. Chile5]|nr:hypothetical protein BBJ28_00018987 [Nothophytophthora sp. Chile5]
MTRPGLLPLLPQSVQEALLPAQDDSDSDQDNEFSSDKQRERALALLEGDSDSAEASREELLKPVTLSASGSAGFDFHRPEVVSTVRPPSSREQVLNEIVTSRIWSGCKDLVKVPAAKTLNRTAAMSSALLVLQLYASRGSRRAFLTFAQFIAASALSSVACCAIFLRLVQLLDLNLTAGRAVPLLRYARQYLLRNGNTGTPQLSAQAANDGGSVSLRAAASSVSVLAAALYVYRKTRR